jgi:hypothetical protein
MQPPGHQIFDRLVRVCAHPYDMTVGCCSPILPRLLPRTCMSRWCDCLTGKVSVRLVMSARPSQHLAHETWRSYQPPFVGSVGGQIVGDICNNEGAEMANTISWPRSGDLDGSSGRCGDELGAGCQCHCDFEYERGLTDR